MKRPLLILIILLLSFSAAMAILSPGFFEVDELSHFLKSREMLHDWTQLLDIWGRPACTGLFGIAVAIGNLFHQPLIAARLLAVVITALTCLGTTILFNTLKQNLLPDPAIPHFTRHSSAWLWILLYAQPFFLLNSFTVMTEMLLACAWVWAAVFLLKSKPNLAALLLGLGGLARPEGWFALAAWPIFLFLWFSIINKKRPPSRTIIPGKIIALLPMLAWYLAGLLAYHNPKWFIDFFPWQTHSQYGTTGLLFIASSLAALALWMWLLVLIGTLHLWKQRNQPALLLLVVPTAAFFLLHATLGTLGLMGALSLPRYFICVSPFLAILSLLGLQSLAKRTSRPKHSRWLRKSVVLATLIPGTLLITLNQLPTPKTTDTRQLDIAIAAFKIHEGNLPLSEQSDQLLANHPYVFYSLNMRMDTPSHDRIFNRELLRTAPVGTKLITDSILWEKENRPTPDDLLAWGYEPDPATAIAVMQVPLALDITTFHPLSKPPTMSVGLWIKQR